MKPNKIHRPATDFMPDSALDEIVHCDTCDEQLIKAFMNDHKCDPNKLQSMVMNNNGQLAEPLAQPIEQ